MLSLLLTAPVLVAAPADHNSIVDVASEAGSFGTLLAAAKAAGLADALATTDGLTVFAPTDAAFAALPHGTVEGLLQPENRERLRTLLQYHVVPGRLDGEAVAARRTLDTLAGPRVAIGLTEAGLTVGGATVQAADVMADNGIIHVVDAVLMPPSENLVEVAAGAGSFGTLLAAAKAAGLAGALAGDGPFTVLAPTDAAFAALGDETIASLLRPENKAQLARILSYHVVPGRVFAGQALTAQSAPSLTGDAVSFAFADGRLTAGDANVLAVDIEASNGVIHVIDRVLMPPAPPQPAGRLVLGIYTERPSSELASYLGVDRRTSMLVTSTTKGSNAERDGVQPRDLIVSIDGGPATDDTLKEAKSRAGFGGQVKLGVLRRGESIEIDVEVGVDRH